MSKTLNHKEMKAYAKKLKKHLRLTYSVQEANNIMDIISKNMDTFFEENPSASFADFETECGSIDEVASSITETEFSQNFSHRWNLLNCRKNFYKLCTFLMILLSIIIGTVYIKGYWDSRKSIPAYEVIITTEETDSIEELDNNER